MKRAVIIYGAVALTAVAVGGYVLWRLRDSMKGTPYEGFALLGFLGHAANSASGGTLERTGAAIGETVFNVFNPGSDAPDVHYAITFPDGSRHAIYAGDIDKSGFFVYGGARYRIVLEGNTKRAIAA